MKKLIIVPDVHGREFWKEVIQYSNIPIIFLGDYLDPYTFEGITEEQAMENFREILTYAKQNSNVHLLIGNHDCGYMFDREICNCRTIADYHGARNLFRNNRNMFSMTYLQGNTLLTHAGVDSRWLVDMSKRGYIELTDNIENDLNNILFELKEGEIIKVLRDVSRRRGGMKDYGSIVWQDINDFMSMTNPLGYNQIVGHTMQLKINLDSKGMRYIPGPPKVNNYFHVACIDCQQLFYLDEEEHLFNFNDEIIPF